MIVLAAMLAIVLVVVAEAEDAEAWQTVTVSGSGGNYFETGYAIYTGRTSTTAPYCSWGYVSGTEERAWMAFKTPVLPEGAYIYQVTVNTYVYSVSDTTSKSISVGMLYFDPRYAEYSSTYSGINYNANRFGRIDVGDYGTYSLTVTSSIYLSDIADAIRDKDDYIFMGYESYAYSYQIRLYNYYSSIVIYYDAMPPVPPTPSTLSFYSPGSSVTLSWSGGYDEPSGGNVGLASYAHEIGAFRASNDESPLFSTPWLINSATSYSVGGLADGTRYYFKLRSRDAAGFISSWGGYAYTTMDGSPPSVPVLEPEPGFTAGTTNIVEWSPSADAGVGLHHYEVQRSTSADFASATTDNAYSTSFTYSSLTGGQRYYYRARSVDSFGYASEWSAVQYTTQDDAPPSVPSVMAEPPYTAGNMNTFQWHPTTDAGVGVAGYRVQVSMSSRFEPGTLVADSAVTGTWLSVGPLGDGTTYYFRAAAYDLFSYSSAWSGVASSTQDSSGPSLPGFAQPPLFSPDAPLVLGWAGSTDAGMGVGWYSVEWASDARFMTNFNRRDHVLGSSYAVTGLTPGTMWYFRVRAWDLLGNPGLFETVNTTIDGAAPTAPVIDDEPAFTAGLENTIAWAEATDELSGLDHYMVRVYGRAGGSGLVFTDTTDALSMTVPGLADGAAYWYEVVAVDGVGNVNASALATSTQDDSPPAVPRLTALPPFTPGSSLSVSWTPSSDRGAGGVEYALEWALDVMFTDGAERSGWLADPAYDLGDLADGATYYLRVTARDALGLESAPSDVVSTTMDDSPPPVPLMRVLEDFVPGPHVHLEWSAMSDASGQAVEYSVMALDSAQSGATVIASSPWLPGTTFEFAGLPSDVEVFFRVMARDPLGHTSELSGAVSCTIDAKGPAAASITTVPAYTKGTAVRLTWAAAADAGIGLVEHRALAFSDEALEVRAFTSDWTPGTTMDVPGLVDGQRYWFVVDCRDGFGNAGARSDAASTTMDATAPSVAVDAPGYFGPADGSVVGTCADAGSGVLAVEASSDSGTTWVAAELSGGQWSVGLDALGGSAVVVWVRATDAVGNVLGTYERASVDTVPPTIAVGMPMAGATVSGAVMLLGSVSDPHLAGYLVEARRAGESAWSTVQPYQATPGVAGTLATWVTAGLTGGEWTLRVTATDAVGLSSQFELAVTLKGAHLTIGTGDISFSDSHPLPGDTVTVLVTVRNDGDSPADNMVVVLYDAGREVGRATTSVQSHSVAVVPLKVKVSGGSHEFTARATSDLYDTGEMPVAQPLKTIEEEATLENAGGILGLVALVLAVLCLLLILLGMRKGKAAPAQAPPPRQDLILEPMQ